MLHKDGYHPEAEDPIDVFDLPPVYKRPTYDELKAALDRLRLPPPSWSSKVASVPLRDSHKKGISTYLAGIIKSDLEWLLPEEVEMITEMAASRLSERCGRTGMSSITRTWTIPASDDSPELSIDLLEPPLTGDNLGLKTWASSYLLAKRLTSLAEQQNLFELLKHVDVHYGVLELGSGTGLVGIAAAALLKCPVVLTDLPEIIDNIRTNINTNWTTVERSGGLLRAEVLDWEDYENATNVWDPKLSKLNQSPRCFPVIIAADVLYSYEHAFVVPHVVDYLLSSSNKSRFIIEVPIRDDATRRMKMDLTVKLNELDFYLIDEGTEEGFDDWEDAHGERAVVVCWWGVWGRQTARKLAS